MNELPDDLTPEEKELQGEQGVSLGALREHHASCPSLEVLMASQAAVLPEETTQKVSAHLAKCTFCQVLLKDLSSGDLIAATSEEERRVRERVFARAKPEKKTAKTVSGFLSGWFWKAIPVTALAAAVIAVAVWIRVQQTDRQVTPPVAVVQQIPKPTAPSVLQWEKLPIKLQAESILIWRGKPRTAQEKYASELTAALAFYRDDNFDEAANQLEGVVKKFPRGVEAQLYLGISQLKLERHLDAIASLRAAQELGPEQFRDDATWYLALAYQRTGQTQASLEELQKLCGGKSSYAARACTAEQKLSAPSEEHPVR